MSLDREQIREDAEAGGAVASEDVLALLAELEQAEVERDALKIAEEEQFTKRGAALADAARCRNRLAKVPALVEALKETQAVLSSFQPMSYTQRNNRVASIVHRALLAWESE